MRWIIATALACGCAVPAVGQAPRASQTLPAATVPEDPLRFDIRCFIAFSTQIGYARRRLEADRDGQPLAARNAREETSSRLALYFLGRIDGRNRGVDIAGRIRQEMTGMKGRDYDALFSACAASMNAAARLRRF